MRIPKEIQVGGKKLKVELVNKWPKVKGEEASATCDTRKFKIKIYNKLTKQGREEAFLHEVMEAINTIFELKLDHWKINTLGEIMYQVIRDGKLEDNNGNAR